MKLKGNLDLGQNQIINVVIDKRATPPATGVQGQFYFNSTDNHLYKHNGTTWISIGSISVASENGSINVTQDADVYNLDINVDNATLEIASSGEVRIKDGGVVTNKLGDGSVTTIKVADNAITFAKIQDIPTMTIIGNLSGNTGDPSAISVINDNTLDGANASNLATAGAIKAYIDASVASLGTIQGGFNANTATQFPGTADTVAGDYWRVTTAGTVQGVSFQVGDIIMASVATPSPTDPNDWVFFEGNRDQASTTVLGLTMYATNAEVQAGTSNNKAVTPAGLSSRTATETRTGLARIATNAEAIAGTDNTTIMTPAKVKALLDASVGGYTALLPSGTSVEVSHGLGTKFLAVEFYLEANGERILCDYFATSNSIVTVVFPVAEPANSIRIVIKK